MLGQKIRDKGYTISRGERDPDIAAIAVPVIKENGKIRGALSVSGLVSHFNEEFEMRFSQELIKETQKLETALSGIQIEE